MNSPKIVSIIQGGTSRGQLWRRHDTRHNDIQHNDTQQEQLISDIEHNVTEQEQLISDIKHNDTQQEELISDIQYNDTVHFAECRILFTLMLNVTKISVVMLNVVAPIKTA